MPRFARVVAPGCPHHVSHRGNRRDLVFFTDEDREEYLMLLRRAADRYGLAVLAYCYCPITSTWSACRRARCRWGWRWDGCI